MSLILTAIGAVLTFATRGDTRDGVVTGTGIALLIVGGGGLLTSLILGETEGRTLPRRRSRRVPRQEGHADVIEEDCSQ